MSPLAACAVLLVASATAVATDAPPAGALAASASEGRRLRVADNDELNAWLSSPGRSTKEDADSDNGYIDLIRKQRGLADSWSYGYDTGLHKVSKIHASQITARKPCVVILSPPAPIKSDMPTSVPLSAPTAVPFPAPTPAPTPSPVIFIEVTGACSYNEGSINDIYASIGRTADGRAYYKGQTNGRFLYFDAACGGGFTIYPRWIFDSDEPSTSASTDLDMDGECSYYGRISYDGVDPPLGANSWAIFCSSGLTWTELTLTSNQLTSSNATLTAEVGAGGGGGSDGGLNKNVIGVIVTVCVFCCAGLFANFCLGKGGGGGGEGGGFDGGYCGGD